MPDRTRVRYSSSRVFDSTGTTIFQPNPIVERFVDFYQQPYKTAVWNPCSHWKLTKPYSGLFSTDLYRRNPYYVDSYGDPELITEAVARIRRSVPNVPLSFEFKENNDFGVIQFLAEIDDTLALFSKKVFQSLTYGGITWGILPLVSDLRAIAATVQDYMSGAHAKQLAALESSNRIKLPFSGRSSTSRFNFTWEGDVTYHGCFDRVVDSPPLLGDILILLDEIGFHPDIATAYDLIPFSFVVDYFLPVGDLLEGIHPRGWFNPLFVFNGYRSIKCSGTVGIGEVVESNRIRSAYSFGFDFYERSSRLVTTVGTVPTVTPIEWKAPSFLEVFNTLYLSSSRR